MIAKQKERQKAIELRQQGLSYREILAQIQVSKASLSLWLKDVTLLPGHAYRITEKRLASARRGALKRKEERVALTKEIKDKARKEIGRLSTRELWLIGIALYWAEGSKEKEYGPGSRVVFSNSDPYMVKLFLKWLLEIIKIPKERIYLSIYIHESHRNNLEKAVNHWSKYTGFPTKAFNKIYFKKNKISTKRRNIGENYFGLLRISVTESSTFNRRIQGWTEGIYGGS